VISPTQFLHHSSPFFLIRVFDSFFTSLCYWGKKENYLLHNVKMVVKNLMKEQLNFSHHSSDTFCDVQNNPSHLILDRSTLEAKIKG